MGYLSQAQRPGQQKPGCKSGLFVNCGRASIRGFTLTELIVTIVVAGILAAVALPRFNGQHGFEERGFRDQTVAALRYAQKSAIAARRPVCAVFTASSLSFTLGSTYSAEPANCGAGGSLLGPNGVAYTLSPPSGVTYTTFPASLVFTPRGSVAATTSIAISGLPANLGITVEQETGYVR